MPRRKVSVELDLEVRDATTGATEAAAALKAVKSEVDDLGDEAKATADDLVEMSAAAKLAEHEVDDLGDKSKRTAMEVKGLDERLKEARADVGRLSVEYAKSSDATVKGQLDDAKRAVALLERTRKDILSFASSAPATKAATLAAAGIEEATASGVKNAVQELGKLGEYARPALIGGLVALSPLIGAAISGAVIGTTVGGGMVGGIVSAIKDPRVMAAFDQFKGQVSAEFFSGGDAFVGPIEASLTILRDDFDKLDLGKTFAKAAPYVTVVADGIGRMAQNLMPGFNAALDKAGPASQIFADGLAEVGTDISNFIEEIASSPGAMEGLADGFHAIGGALQFIGKGIHFLEDLYDLAKKLGVVDLVKGLVGDIEQGIDWADKLVSGTASLIGALNPFDDQAMITSRAAGANVIFGPVAVAQMAAAAAAQRALNIGMDNSYVAANRERDAMIALGRAMDDANKSAHDLWETNLDVASGFMDITDAIKQGNKGFDDSTRAGIQNQQMVDAQIKKLEQERDAQLAASDQSTASKNAILKNYDDQIDKLKQLAKQLGASKTQLDEIDGYKIDITVNIRTVTSGSGLYDSIDAAFQHGGKAAPSHRAAGGSVLSGRWYTVNEQRPEVFSPFTRTWQAPSDGMVMPAAAVGSGWSAGPAAASGGIATLTVIVRDTSGTTLHKELFNSAVLVRGVPVDVARKAYP